MLNSEYTELISSLDKELGECINDTKIIEARNIFINKNVTPLYQKIKTIPNDQKAEFGKQLNELKATIEEHVNKYLQEHLLQKEKTDHVVNYDILAQTSDFTKGSVSPITLVFRQILGYFESLNFTIQSGEEVMQSKYNFDHLNVPETHPTRETSETFYVKSDKSASLRTQNTASSAAFIDNFKGDELRVCNFGYTYRNDDDDPTHTHQFNQIDFIWIKKGLNVGNLKWVINGFIKHIFGNETKTRFRLSNFAFTEPSFEVDAECPFCGGKGCTRCKQSGWIELLGAGLMHQKVMEHSNIPHLSGIAAGMGIERMAMTKYGITDIRDVYNNDFRFIKQFGKGNK